VSQSAAVTATGSYHGASVLGSWQSCSCLWWRTCKHYVNNVPCILHLEALDWRYLQQLCRRYGVEHLVATFSKKSMMWAAIWHVSSPFESYCFWHTWFDWKSIAMGLSMQSIMAWRHYLSRQCQNKKVVNRINVIIELCISPDDGGEECIKLKGWNVAYQNAMQCLQKRTDLNNHKVKSFQQQVDAFFVTCVSLILHEGVTNYIQMLGSGHIGEYLLHHCKLYKHSQQGWEAFNSLLKTFFLLYWLWETVVPVWNQKFYQWHHLCNGGILGVWIGLGWVFLAWKQKNAVLGIKKVFGVVQSGLKLVLLADYDGHIIVLHDL